MTTSHNLIQGSSAWHQFRATHFGASEASAMLGLSPYKTRAQLLNEKKTGFIPEVDAQTQKVFDKGHAVEALARPIVEKMIGEELSPMTFSNGKLSASCDGLSFMGDVAWENKQFNVKLFTQVSNGELPEAYWPQCQQVIYCSGAEKLFFTVSDGTEDRTAGVWVYPDADKQGLLVAGWEQFEQDLSTHVPPVIVAKVEAETMQTLPVPNVVVRGEITASNLTEITPLFDNYITGIKTELSTDQDFADAEANAKNCRETANRIKSLRANIIAQMVDVNAVDSTLANYEEAFNKIGLRLEKAVKEQKDTLKSQAIIKARLDYADFVAELNKTIPSEICLMSQRLICPDFQDAIKGVKTIETMQSRIDSALANGKAEATILAADVKTKLAYIGEASKGYEHLVNVRDIVFSDIDYIKLYIQSVKDKEDARKALLEEEIKAKILIENEKKQAEIISDKKQNNVVTENVITFKQPEIKPHAVTDEDDIPSAHEIINLVATTWNVSSETALKYLLDANFQYVTL